MTLLLRLSYLAPSIIDDILAGRNPVDLSPHRLMRLSKGLYSIHGTDVPWSIGRLTTHGCIRLYPEDISELYGAVSVGTLGELVYQPIKFGESNGQVYVEVHDDIYKRIPNLEQAAFALARRHRVIDRIDANQLRQAVRERRGMPVIVSRTASTSVINTTSMTRC